MLWILRTGAPWRDLPSCFPSWSSVYTRFWRSPRNRLWARLLRVLSEQADTEYVMIDSTAHQHSACAREQQDNQALGHSRGGLSTKLHWLCDPLGYPLGLIATAGQKSESTQALALLKQCPKPFENLIAKLKHSRRLATRYDKKAEHFIAFAYLAAIRIWLTS